MKYLNYKDLSRRKLSHSNELERLRVKSIVYETKLPMSIRFFYSQKLSTFNPNTSFNRIKNRCLVTANSRSVYRAFKLNRITLREFIAQNKLPGIKKSSW